MTLLVVLMFGFGIVLVMSAVETDKATGKSVSVTQTIQDVWQDKLDFSQVGGTGTKGSGVAYVPPSPSTTTLLSYQQATTANYLQARTM